VKLGHHALLDNRDIGLLIAAQGPVVSAAQLVDELWGESAPPRVLIPVRSCRSRRPALGSWHTLFVGEEVATTTR
jgi:hypothetical protein